MNLNLIYETLWTRAGTGMSILMLGLSCPSKINCGSYIFPFAQTASNKIGALICFIKFPSCEAAIIYSSLIYIAAIISINPPFSLVWDTVVMSVLMEVIAAWMCWISYRGRYVGMLVLHLLLHLDPWLIVSV